MVLAPMLEKCKLLHIESCVVQARGLPAPGGHVSKTEYRQLDRKRDAFVVHAYAVPDS